MGQQGSAIDIVTAKLMVRIFNQRGVAEPHHFSIPDAVGDVQKPLVSLCPAESPVRVLHIGTWGSEMQQRSLLLSMQGQEDDKNSCIHT